MAVWQYPEYSSNGTIEAYLTSIANTAIANADSAADALAAITIPLSDTVADPTLLDPSTIALTLPTEPTSPTVTVPTIDVPPSLTALTMSAVITDLIIGDILTAIKTTLLARLAGGTGLNATVEAALWNRGRDRANKEAYSAYGKLLNINGARGWSVPQGADLSAYQQILLAGAQTTQDLNREITIEQARLEQDNLKHSIEQIIALEGLLINAKAGDESNKLRKYEDEWEAYVNRIKAYYELSQISVGLYQADIQKYQVTGQLKTQEAQVLIAKFNAINQANTGVKELAIEKVKMVNAYNVSRAQALGDAYKGAGTIQGQIAATALNGMNISTSFSYSQSKSEGHSFDNV